MSSGALGFFRKLGTDIADNSSVVVGHSVGEDDHLGHPALDTVVNVVFCRGLF